MGRISGACSRNPDVLVGSAVSSSRPTFVLDASSRRKSWIQNQRPPAVCRRPLLFSFMPGATAEASTLDDLHPSYAPADHHGLERTAGFVVTPLTVHVVAGERQFVGSASVFAQYLDRYSRRRFAGTIKFS